MPGIAESFDRVVNEILVHIAFPRFFVFFAFVLDAFADLVIGVDCLVLFINLRAEVELLVGSIGYVFQVFETNPSPNPAVRFNQIAIQWNVVRPVFGNHLASQVYFGYNPGQIRLDSYLNPACVWLDHFKYFAFVGICVFADAEHD